MSESPHGRLFQINRSAVSRAIAITTEFIAPLEGTIDLFRRKDPSVLSSALLRVAIGRKGKDGVGSREANSPHSVGSKVPGKKEVGH
jgi:hypothetical protein